MGGIRAVAKGFNEQCVLFALSSVHNTLDTNTLVLNHSELFVADQGCNLFSLDLRNGSIIYGYKGNVSRLHHSASSCSLTLVLVT